MSGHGSTRIAAARDDEHRVRLDRRDRADGASPIDPRRSGPTRRRSPLPAERSRVTTGSPSVDADRLMSSTGEPARMPSTKHRRAARRRHRDGPRSSSPQNGIGSRSRRRSAASGPRSGAATGRRVERRRGRRAASRSAARPARSPDALERLARAGRPDALEPGDDPDDVRPAIRAGAGLPGFAEPVSRPAVRLPPRGPVRAPRGQGMRRPGTRSRWPAGSGPSSRRSSVTRASGTGGPADVRSGKRRRGGRRRRGDGRCGATATATRAAPTGIGRVRRSPRADRSTAPARADGAPASRDQRARPRRSGSIGPAGRRSCRASSRGPADRPGDRFDELTAVSDAP